MKKIVIAILLVTVGLFGQTYDLKPIKVTKDITCVMGDLNPPTNENRGFVSNVCYVNIGDSLVVLDSGPTYKFAEDFYALMKKEYPKLEVSYVVLSNYHDDRIQGASFFKNKGAKIVGHSTINDDIKENGSKFERMKSILLPEIYDGTEVIFADTLVDDQYKIKGSDKILTIIKPSEASEEKSDIAIYSKNDSFLFVGNIVFNGRLLSYKETSDIDGWIEAIENLAKIDAKYLLGGHGKEYDKNSYQASLEYLKTMRADVKKAYENGVDLLEIKEHVDTKRFNYLRHFDQLNTLNITTYYNQLEWQ